MSRFNPRYRRSTDIFTPNLWFVYKEPIGKGEIELIRECDSEEDAKQYAIDVYRGLIQTMLRRFDSSFEFTNEDAKRGFIGGLTQISLVEALSKSLKINLDSYKPLKGEIGEFSETVKQLTRPYFGISKEEYDALYAVGCDYFETSDGQVVTFGSASTAYTNFEYAIMPLTKEASKAILRNQ